MPSGPAVELLVWLIEKRMSSRVMLEQRLGLISSYNEKERETKRAWGWM
jgi:hypothetical protein